VAIELRLEEAVMDALAVGGSADDGVGDVRQRAAGLMPAPAAGSVKGIRRRSAGVDQEAGSCRWRRPA